MHRIFSVVVTALLLAGLASRADAVITYEFSAEVVGEFDFGTNSPVAPGDRIYADGTFGSLLFTYDPTTAPSATNIDVGGALAAYGLFSIYDNAVTDMSGTAAGDNFSVTAGNVLVGDGAGTDLLSGYFGNGNSGGPGWSGFSIGNFALTGFTVFTVGFDTMLPNQSLPPSWELFGDLPGGLNSGLNLLFEDTTGAFGDRAVQFHGNATIRTVPEPGSVLLLLGGLVIVVRRCQRPS